MSNKKYDIISDDEILDKTSEVTFKIRNSGNLKDICKKLNSGYGFNGFTPSFFSINYIKENADDR